METGNYEDVDTFQQKQNSKKKSGHMWNVSLCYRVEKCKKETFLLKKTSVINYWQTVWLQLTQHRVQNQFLSSRLELSIKKHVNFTEFSFMAAAMLSVLFLVNNNYLFINYLYLAINSNKMLPLRLLNVESRNPCMTSQLLWLLTFWVIEDSSCWAHWVILWSFKMFSDSYCEAMLLE